MIVRMGKRIGLIACCGAKLPLAAPARDLYRSDLFRKSLSWAGVSCDQSMVLSAKYGLVEMGRVIEPYDETLNELPLARRQVWAEGVWTSLQERLLPDDHVVILAGLRYREYLIPKLEAAGVQFSVPMAGMGIGMQKQWLADMVARSCAAR